MGWPGHKPERARRWPDSGRRGLGAHAAAWRLLACTGIAGMALLTGSAAEATFGTGPSAPAMTLATPTLAPPTGLSGSCPALSNAVVLTWTASASSFATGYSVLRSTTNGSGYSKVGTVSGASTVTYRDPLSGLLNSTTYYYVLQTTASFTNPWSSVNSAQASVAVTIALGLCA